MASSKASGNFSKKATVADEAGQPRRSGTPPTPATNTHTITINHDPYQQPGPGFNHTITNYPNGWSVDTINGPNPSLGVQTAHLHQTPGLAQPTHVHTTGQYPSHYTTINPQQAYSSSSFVNPPTYSVNQNNTSAMADYNNGNMPNTGQHFQPPVPDTTYGPIQHTYQPRFDNGVHPNQNGHAYYVNGYHPGFVAPIATGMATAPIQVPHGHVHHHHVQQPQQGPVCVGGGPIMQGYVQQPVMHQCAHVAGGQPQIAGCQGVPGMVHGGVFPPDVMGIGKTAGEIAAEQFHSTLTTNIMEPQDIKPGDDDPSRMYFCRELDGNWTQRNRFTLDNLPIRWYVTENGAFYAVRLED